jgi:hypothetical protein
MSVSEDSRKVFAAVILNIEVFRRLGSMGNFLALEQGGHQAQGIVRSREVPHAERRAGR